VFRLLQIRKTALTIIPVFLLVVIFSLTNATINQHLHKLTSGIIIKHAHPFDRENTGRPFQEHRHTTDEYIILEQISNIVFWIYLFILLLPLSLFIRKAPDFHLVVIFKNPNLFFLRNYHAPPESLN